MALRFLTVAALCLVPGTIGATREAYGNGSNGTLHASALKSCSASMDGRLPSPTPSDFHFSGNVRRYYVAAEEMEWDYAPTGWDNWLGACLKTHHSASPIHSC